jgi:hypothetical protein
MERGLAGVGDKLRGFRVDGDVATEQHAAGDLPGVPSTERDRDRGTARRQWDCEHEDRGKPRRGGCLA